MKNKKHFRSKSAFKNSRTYDLKTNDISLSNREKLDYISPNFFINPFAMIICY